MISASGATGEYLSAASKIGGAPYGLIILHITHFVISPGVIVVLPQWETV